MTFDQYQRASARTINTDLGYQDQLANAGLGISDEAGDVAEANVKKLEQRYPKGFSAADSINRGDS